MIIKKTDYAKKEKKDKHKEAIEKLEKEKQELEAKYSELKISF